MTISLTEIFNSIITERKLEVDKKLLTIERGKIKLWHYSDKEITDNIVPKSPSGAHSKDDRAEWSKPRAYFYATEAGVDFDKGVPKTYKYICYIDKKKVYDPNKNPEGYTGDFDEKLKQMYDDGYTAWIFNLGGNPKVPIVASFEEVPISESFVQQGGIDSYVPNRELVDYKVGEIEIDGKLWYVVQEDGAIQSLANCYLRDPDEWGTNSRYKKPLPEYLFKYVKIDKKYKGLYKK